MTITAINSKLDPNGVLSELAKEDLAEKVWSLPEGVRAAAIEGLNALIAERVTEDDVDFDADDVEAVFASLGR